jgi:hypothetical protein
MPLIHEYMQVYWSCQPARAPSFTHTLRVLAHYSIPNCLPLPLGALYNVCISNKHHYLCLKGLTAGDGVKESRCCRCWGQLQTAREGGKYFCGTLIKLNCEVCVCVCVCVCTCVCVCVCVRVCVCVCVCMELLREETLESGQARAAIPAIAHTQERLRSLPVGPGQVALPLPSAVCDGGERLLCMPTIESPSRAEAARTVCNSACHFGMIWVTQSLSEDKVQLQEDRGSALKPDFFDMDTWVSSFEQCTLMHDIVHLIS